MGLWKSLTGIYTVKITSAAPADMLTLINASDIVLFDIVQTGDLTVTGSIYKSDYKRLCKLLINRGEKLEILQRRGVYWTAAGLRRRPVLLIGLTVYLILVLYLPTRVFFVRVEGNQTIPTQKILEDAEKCGIYFGALRRDVRSEKVKNALLAEVPQLQWAGVNTVGCVAVISVQERSVASDNEQTNGVSSIVAKCDGVIRELTVLRGNALCKVGQAVKAGQVLVSGYTDCGITIQATNAQAEVYAQTRHVFDTVTPVCYETRGASSGKETRYRLQLGKKVINLFKDSGISDTSCVKIYKKHYLMLPGGFQLPVALVQEDLLYYNNEVVSAGESEDFSWLENQSKNYLLEHMLAGEILNADLVTEHREDVVYQYGDYACLEMIGQVRSEEIIQGNGKGN